MDQEPTEFETLAAGIGCWMVGDGTGVSSEMLAAVALTGDPHLRGKWTGAYPSDQPDLQRCIRLIDEVPGVAKALPVIAARCPVWAAYVRHWDELELLARAGDYDRTTARMRELQIPAAPPATA